MKTFNNSLNFILLIINIFFLLYYSIQLLIFTDEFALKNIGFYNHAVAGLSEIIGIIFFSLSIGLIICLFKGLNNQKPLFFTIFIIEFLISFNFWRYVFTDSPGETNLEIISFNASVFSILSICMLLLIIRSNNKNY